MEKLNVSDAKAHFAEVIERAQSGGETVITRHGRIVAKIVPAQKMKWDRAAVLDEIDAVRKSLKNKGSINIRKLIEYGRR